MCKQNVFDTKLLEPCQPVMGVKVDVDVIAKFGLALTKILGPDLG